MKRLRVDASPRTENSTHHRLYWEQLQLHNGKSGARVKLKPLFATLRSTLAQHFVQHFAQRFANWQSTASEGAVPGAGSSRKGNFAHCIVASNKTPHLRRFT
ncbi:MAG: hypothetical protein QFF03_00460 [Pseudomonadota bacterium]|nr:hypothetical protein [Pseudomonadota bacterium]